MSSWYTLVGAPSGEIVGCFTSDAALVEQNTPDGHYLVNGLWDASAGYFLGAVFIPYTPEQVLLKASPPGKGRVWDNQLFLWVETRTMVEQKAAKNNQINTWRLQATYGGFVYQGKRIATDELSLIDLTNTGNRITRTGALPDNWPGGWKAVDNTYIAITTVAAWDAMYEAMYQQGLANFVTSQVLKAQVAAANTIAEVDSVVWPD